MAEETKKEDFSDALAAAIPAAEARAKGGDLAGAVEDLLSVEKKTRVAGDAFATSKAAVAIVKLCFESKDLKQLNAQVLALSKRRGQLKQVISDMVQTAMTFIGQITNKDDKLELITTLKMVTDGKIYVEVERARITRMLASIKEQEGKINEASEVLQEVAVETYGSMEKKEKAEIILEQMRLTMRQRDFVRMGILANKINKKVLDEEGFEDLRVRYYNLMGLLAHARHDSLALCKGYMAILQTRGYAADEAKWKPALASAIVYLALSPFDNEVSDLLHRLKEDKRTSDLPSHKALLTYLTTQELIPWPLPSPHHETIAAHPAFSIDPNTVGAPGGHGSGPEFAPISAFAMGDSSGDVEMSGGTGSSLSSNAAAGSSAASSAAAGPASFSQSRPSGALKSSIVTKEDEDRSQWLPILHKRIVQHNVRVIAKDYARVRFDRLSSILGLDAPTSEAMVSELVSGKSIYARIDRPAGIVVFERPRPASEVLSEWGSDLDTVLSLLEKTTHLIQKEYMVHAVQA